jgi:hypothetical protein
MFSDPPGTIPTLTTDTVDGFASTIDVNLDGTTTVTDPSIQTIIASSTVIPEPSNLLLMATGFCGLAGILLRQQAR